jgi:hypothetical protein
MQEAWNDFKDQYNDDIFRPLIAYIENEWLNKDTQHGFLAILTFIFILICEQLRVVNDPTGC